MNLRAPLRPFPTRLLTQKVSLVQLQTNALLEEHVRAMGENAWELVPWQQSLHFMMDITDGLAASSMELRAYCSTLFDRAPEDQERAQRAAVMLLEAWTRNGNGS